MLQNNHDVLLAGGGGVSRWLDMSRETKPWISSFFGVGFNSSVTLSVTLSPLISTPAADWVRSASKSPLIRVSGLLCGTTSTVLAKDVRCGRELLSPTGKSPSLGRHQRYWAASTHEGCTKNFPCCFAHRALSVPRSRPITCVVSEVVVAEQLAPSSAVSRQNGWTSGENIPVGKTRLNTTRHSLRMLPLKDWMTCKAC